MQLCFVGSPEMLMQLDDRGVDQPIGQENVGQLVTMDTGNILYS